jgi:hypothetical protein
MQRLTPGVYVDSEKALHFDLLELCIDAGVAPTEENAATIEKIARQAVCEAYGPHLTVSHVESED